MSLNEAQLANLPSDFLDSNWENYGEHLTFFDEIHQQPHVRFTECGRRFADSLGAARYRTTGIAHQFRQIYECEKDARSGSTLQHHCFHLKILQQRPHHRPRLW